MPNISYFSVSSVNHQPKYRAMKRIIPFLFICSVAASGHGQTIEDEPFYDIVSPDHVVGNDQVPDFYNTDVSLERYFVTRLKHRKDILEGLNEIVKAEKIRNAVILTGIGSVTNYHIHVVDNSTFPSKNVFIKKDIPMDVTNITGYIVDGRVHCHITLSDENMAIGGHLEPGTRVFTFCIITIGILNDDSSLKRFDDSTLR
jgi:predicted DNA-binding protein with PD1-like motif